MPKSVSEEQLAGLWDAVLNLALPASEQLAMVDLKPPAMAARLTKQTELAPRLQRQLLGCYRLVDA